MSAPDLAVDTATRSPMTSAAVPRVPKQAATLEGGTFVFRTQVRAADAWRRFVPTQILAEGGWSRPCEELFRVLASRAPVALIALIESNALAPSALTYAAEIAGELRDAGATAALVSLLDHASSVVREGAIYGLAKQSNNDLRKRLQRLAVYDPSPGVRDAAREVIEDA